MAAWLCFWACDDRASWWGVQGRANCPPHSGQEAEREVDEGPGDKTNLSKAHCFLPPLLPCSLLPPTRPHFLMAHLATNFLSFFLLLFICAYNAWVIPPPPTRYELAMADPIDEVGALMIQSPFNSATNWRPSLPHVEPLGSILDSSHDTHRASCLGMF
jgi:hypothetical protein